MDWSLLITLIIAFLIISAALMLSIYYRFKIERSYTGPTGPTGSNITPRVISNFSFDYGRAGMVSDNVDINTTVNQHLFLQNNTKGINIKLESASPGNLIYIYNNSGAPAIICTKCSDGNDVCAGDCPDGSEPLWKYAGTAQSPLNYTLNIQRGIGIYILPNNLVVLDSNFP